MNDKWKPFLYDLANHNIDFLIGNLDKLNFGDRDFMTKMMIRLVLRKVQTALRTKRFGESLRDLINNLATIAK